ncbi:MAG: superoxide dismutase [Candidatus Micrarchaeota archaeon]|nr:superoxide dismutase [Candidatus Micrarchaeota archaeon]
MSNTEANHAVKSMPIAFDKVKNVMDEDTYKWHHDTHYAGYVNKRNEIEKELKSVDRSKANVNYSAFRALKLEETWNGNGMILHEVYWDTMGGDGKHGDGMGIIKKISEDFGSVQAWKEDFLATGKSGRGWAVLVADSLTDGKLRNVLFDFHNLGGLVGSMPLIAVDTFEHAYYHKFGPDRGAYLNALVDNIDWKKVEARFTKHRQ